MEQLGNQAEHDTLMRQIQRHKRGKRIIISAFGHRESATGQIRVRVDYADGGSETCAFGPEVDSQAHKRRKPKMEA